MLHRFGFTIQSVFIAITILFGCSLLFAAAQTNSFQENINQERAALEAELAELEQQIAENETHIQEYRKQGRTLSAEIHAKEHEIEKLNLQIRAITLNLKELDTEIVTTQKQIGTTEDEIVLQKRNLTELLQAVYEQDTKTIMEVMLANPSLSDFFIDLEGILIVQDNLQVVLSDIVTLREQLLVQKEELAVEKADAEELRVYQQRQKSREESVKQEKDQLLTVTKGKESEYQKIVEEQKQTAAEIRKRIFRILGGGELSFEEAYNLALLAEKATGVRAAVLLAVLDRESALGRNVGGCTYHRAMHPRRDIPFFLEITKSLGLDPETTKVSCPNSDGAYGGAMGPAQFIPSTWDIYKDEIAAVTGNSPASPWRNADAFVATALYLADALNSSSCQDYSTVIPSQKQTLLERCAAAKYYAGGNWYRFRWAYGEPVVQKASAFQKDIDILTS